MLLTLSYHEIGSGACINKSGHGLTCLQAVLLLSILNHTIDADAAFAKAKELGYMG